MSELRNYRLTAKYAAISARLGHDDRQLRRGTRSRASSRCVWLLLLASALALAACGDDEPGAPDVTYYRDIEPIVHTVCSCCHAAGGPAGITLNEETMPALARVAHQRVVDREMPPWPPAGGDNPEFIGDLSLSAEQIDLFGDWVDAGAPLGDLADRQEGLSCSREGPSGQADIAVKMPEAYLPDPGLEDDVRCFLIDLPIADNTWVTALSWDIEHTAGVHHIGGAAAAPEVRAQAEALDAQHPGPGWPCTGGLGVPVVAGFGANSGSNGLLLPSGTGIFVPQDAFLVLTVHYWLPGINEADRSGVKLWTSPAQGLRPLIPWTMQAPSDLPCPTGVTSDPGDRCSRDFAIDQVDGFDPLITRAFNDLFLKQCGYDLGALLDEPDYTMDNPEQFLLARECTKAFPYDGTVYWVHGHMHTRGHSARVERRTTAADPYTPLLDIPRWDWRYEASYAIRDGVSIAAGDDVHVTCEFDNGAAAQPARVDQPTVRELPRYIVAGEGRADEMCTGTLTFTPAPHAGQNYPSLCHEAKAKYDDRCGPSMEWLSERLFLPNGNACGGIAERLSVQLFQSPDDFIDRLWCNPEPTDDIGQTCRSGLTCAIYTCNWNETCIANTCRPSLSPQAAYRLDNVLWCAKPWCTDEAGDDGVLCAGVGCTSFFTTCWGPN